MTEWVDEDVRVRNLLCSIIIQAVEDYRACAAMDFVNREYFDRNYFNKYRIENQWRSTKNITAESEVRSLITFFFRGDLDCLIEAGKLQDPTSNNRLSGDAIRYKLKQIWD